jgi:hypothetical protein
MGGVSAQTGYLIVKSQSPEYTDVPLMALSIAAFLLF